MAPISRIELRCKRQTEETEQSRGVRPMTYHVKVGMRLAREMVRLGRTQHL